MSNFSHNEDLHKQNSYSEAESKPSREKTIAFLAALEETENILNVLLQAVVYRENTNSYRENTLPSRESKENQTTYQHFNEPTKNGTSKCDNLLVPTCISSKETIPLVTSSIDDVKITALPWSTQNSLELNYVYDNKDQEVPAQPLFSSPFNKSNIISTTLNQQDSYLSDNIVESEQPPMVYKLEPEILVDAETTKYCAKRNISTILNNHNNCLSNSSTIPSENSFGLQQLTIEKKVGEEEILQMPQETNNSEDCESPLLNEQRLHLQTTYDGENDLEITEVPIKQTELSAVEEIKKLLQFTQNSYIFCEKKVNTILKQIHNESFVNVPQDESSNPSCSTTRTFLEPRISNLQKEIRPREMENKKTTLLHMPPESIPNSPSCEKEMVGDDLAKTKTHILCECEQPGVAGGAVPVVTSFIVAKDNSIKDDENFAKIKSNIEKPVFKIDRQQENVLQKANYTPIPKAINSCRNSFTSNLLSRTEKQRCLISSLIHEETEEQKQHFTINTSPKLVSLHDMVKPTTSLNRGKIVNNEGNPENEKHKTAQNEKFQLRFDDEHFEKRKRQKTLRYEFSQNIDRVAQDANNLKEINNLSAQTAAIDNLYKCITELKRLSSELKDIHSTKDENTCVADRSQDMNGSESSSLESEHKLKIKDNKIYIKFLPTKIGLKKRKSCNTEVQTESIKDSVSAIPSDSEIREKKPHGENGLKDIDSMDGMFIPSSEEPLRMEEDEDENGLDITITFPEFQQHIMHQASSHLSVCFSDISAEALGRLKRCPKEFTLRMDFVHGKMFFQSGKSPPNNFSIGPDLKITECALDDKMSDIISIKPSTECMYTSQLIPVEGTKPKSSIRTLKSTDSELFNVVSLPKINRKTSGNTKSCITFKNEGCHSTGCLLSNRRLYKSMPQIPSLTRILEEPAMESASTSRAAMMNSDKKPRNRTLQKKKNNASLEKLSEG